MFSYSQYWTYPTRLTQSSTTPEWPGSARTLRISWSRRTCRGRPVGTSVTSPRTVHASGSPTDRLPDPTAAPSWTRSVICPEANPGQPTSSSENQTEFTDGAVVWMATSCAVYEIIDSCTYAIPRVVRSIDNFVFLWIDWSKVTDCCLRCVVTRRGYGGW